GAPAAVVHGISHRHAAAFRRLAAAARSGPHRAWPAVAHPALLHRPARPTHARTVARGARNRRIPAHGIPGHPDRHPRHPGFLDAATPQARRPSNLTSGGSLAAVTSIPGFRSLLQNPEMLLVGHIDRPRTE